MCVGLCVAEDWYCALVDGGEVYEEHVKSAAPIIGLAREKLSSLRWIKLRKALVVSKPRERACCRYPVGLSLAWSAIARMGNGRSH